MLVLLDGPDGAGKSTLAGQLQDAMPGAAYMHHGPYKGASGAELASALMVSMRPSFAGVDTVVDRCWLSEPVYAAVYRKQPSRLSPSHVRMLERAALTQAGVIVMCLPPFEVCVRAFTSGRDEMMSDLEDLRRVYERYALGPETDLPVVKYDFTTDSVDDLIAKIDALDYPRPKAVLIGDRPSLRTHAQRVYHVPFVTFSGRGCSDWLADQLDTAGIRERDLDWYNAYDSENTPLDPGVLVEGAVVVAMGRSAEQWCVDHGISHRFCPHPNSHKRFHHHKPYILVDILKEICNGKN